jgi:hypothetical protein
MRDAGERLADEAEARLRGRDPGGALALLDDAAPSSSAEARLQLLRAECLHALERRGEARAALSAARARLTARAALVSDAAWRESFLRFVSEHARILELAGRWLG